MIKSSAAVVAVLAVAGLAACSSSSSTTSGTERLSGKVTGAAAIANATVWPNVSWTGPVTTTGSFAPGAPTPAIGDEYDFPTKAGKLELKVTAKVTMIQSILSTKTCAVVFGLNVPYTVVGAKSTGSFKDATGSGTVYNRVTAFLPKLKSGACNESTNAQPTSSGAVSTIYGGGPLTVKS